MTRSIQGSVLEYPVPAAEISRGVPAGVQEYRDALYFRELVAFAVAASARPDVPLPAPTQPIVFAVDTDASAHEIATTKARREKFLGRVKALELFSTLDEPLDYVSGESDPPARHRLIATLGSNMLVEHEVIAVEQGGHPAFSYALYPAEMISPDT